MKYYHRTVNEVVCKFYLFLSLGFSLPLSASMMQLVVTVLREGEGMRDKAWVCKGAGGEGDRHNFWIYSAQFRKHIEHGRKD